MVFTHTVVQPVALSVICVRSALMLQQSGLTALDFFEEVYKNYELWH